MPVIWLLNAAANGVLRLFRVEPKNEAASTFTLDEVATIVSQSRREGVLMDTAGTVTAAVEFTDKKARDVAVPLSDLVTLPQTTTPDDIEKAVARYGFSRYVIVDDEDVPIGYVHLKDILRASEGPDAEAKVLEPIPGKRIHHMVPVQEDTDLEDALAVMRRAGRHLAKVRDARGRRPPCCSWRTSSRSSSARCRTRPVASAVTDVATHEGRRLPREPAAFVVGVSASAPARTAAARRPRPQLVRGAEREVRVAQPLPSGEDRVGRAVGEHLFGLRGRGDEADGRHRDPPALADGLGQRDLVAGETLMRWCATRPPLETSMRSAPCAVAQVPTVAASSGVNPPSA